MKSIKNKGKTIKKHKGKTIKKNKNTRSTKKKGGSYIGLGNVEIADSGHVKIKINDGTNATQKFGLGILTKVGVSKSNITLYDSSLRRLKIFGFEIPRSNNTIDNKNTDYVTFYGVSNGKFNPLDESPSLLENDKECYSIQPRYSFIDSRLLSRFADDHVLCFSKILFNEKKNNLRVFGTEEEPDFDDNYGFEVLISFIFEFFNKSKYRFGQNWRIKIVKAVKITPTKNGVGFPIYTNYEDLKNNLYEISTARKYEKFWFNLRPAFVGLDRLTSLDKTKTADMEQLNNIETLLTPDEDQLMFKKNGTLNSNMIPVNNSNFFNKTSGIVILSPVRYSSYTPLANPATLSSYKSNSQDKSMTNGSRMSVILPSTNVGQPPNGQRGSLQSFDQPPNGQRGSVQSFGQPPNVQRDSVKSVVRLAVDQQPNVQSPPSSQRRNSFLGNYGLDDTNNPFSKTQQFSDFNTEATKRRITLERPRPPSTPQMPTPSSVEPIIPLRAQLPMPPLKPPMPPHLSTRESLAIHPESPVFNAYDERLNKLMATLENLKESGRTLSPDQVAELRALKDSNKYLPEQQQRLSPQQYPPQNPQQPQYPQQSQNPQQPQQLSQPQYPQQYSTFQPAQNTDGFYQQALNAIDNAPRLQPSRSLGENPP